MKALEYYKKNEQPPQWALKQITGGRLNGKTDINPQWRYLALTETFGLCGVGWKYEITKQWLENGANNEICAFVNINLFINIDSEWSQAIPGNGGAMFVASEKNGLYTSDEAFKMATTDALSVACKMLGIGAAVYSGSKYTPTKPVLTVENSAEIIDLQKNLKNCHNSDDLKLLYDSLEPNEQVSYKALFTKRRLEIDKK